MEGVVTKEYLKKVIARLNEKHAEELAAAEARIMTAISANAAPAAPSDEDEIDDIVG